MDKCRNTTAQPPHYNDEDSIWNQFNAEYGTVLARAVSIVPLEDEVDARAASTSKKPPAEPEPISTPVVRKRVAPKKGAQLDRREEDQKPMTGYFKVGTTLAYVLFDLGSCTDMISPTFVRVANITPMALDKPIGLQLALKDVAQEFCRIPAPAPGFRGFGPLPALAPAPAAGMPEYWRNPAISVILAAAGFPYLSNGIFKAQNGWVLGVIRPNRQDA
ncbi:hypothetical protein RhiLY_02552 [Ceratobasidium sp. AG-Ba]|nr:hypothetical protein RhiLY_02552 [Ceratobasidium sp. AG-Ba]